MIQGHEKFRIPDENKTHELQVEVNWNPTDTKTNKCKMLKLIFPNGNEALVKREHFQAIVFALSEPESQRKMIPQTISNTRWYETVVSVKAKKNIQAGEEITFPIKLTLPTLEDEVIGEMKRELVEKGKIIIKK